MWLHKLRKNKRGISTVIAVVLSLVILVVVVENIVLWSYQINQFDWERMHESLSLAVISRSTWFVAQSEYAVNNGSITAGSYLDTQNDDGVFETFTEQNTTPMILDVNGTFLIDLTKYPLNYIQGFEILIKFQASDLGDLWYLKAYNWTAQDYGNSGFNCTTGFAPTTTTGWDYYAVSITNQWTNYVRNDGKMFIKFQDSNTASTNATVKINFLGVRAIIALFSFKNDGPVTSNVVTLWVINSTIHNHYSVDYFINSGMNSSFFGAGIQLPRGSCTVKAITELGNIAMYSMG